MPNALSKSAASRLKILDAAARLFRQKGYAATTLSEIGQAADMRAASLYYHFDSKDQILEEVLDIGITRVFDAVKASVAALPPQARFADRLRAAVEAHLAMLLRHGDYTSANIRIFGQAPAEVQRRHAKLREAYGDYWRGLLKEGQAAGEIRADADLSLVRMLLLGAINWSVEWYKPRGKPIRALADELCTMVLRGIGAGRGEARPTRAPEPASNPA